MIPVDKFGRRIFDYKFDQLLENGNILLKQGYFEAKSKPNLFCKKTSKGWFYADMRGTAEVPIWEDTRPLFYWNFKREIPMWERRRLIKKELVELFNENCPCRLSFEVGTCEEFEQTSTYVNEENGEFIWNDGYCRFCGKDFQQEGEFCSKTCEENYEETLKLPCEVCGKKIERFKEVRHHITYYPEKVVFVHASCHNKIHKTNLFPELKPSQEEIDKFYKNKLKVTTNV